MNTPSADPRLGSRPLGRTGLHVTGISWGTAALGDMPDTFGFAAGEEMALETLRAMLASPVTLIDTSANYGHGVAESRLGRVLAEIGGPPPGVTISTKADRKPGTADFSPGQMRRSVEESTARLGVDFMPLVHLHDPEHGDFHEITRPGGGLAELVALKSAGVIGSLGLAGGPVALMSRYLDTGAFDALITHNRWTLLDRSADALINKAVGMGVGVLNAAPFGSGVLTGRVDRTRYGYKEANPELLARVTSMQDACERHGVTLRAAALAFSVRDARIASTIVGASRPGRIEQVLDLLDVPIPDALWPELDTLALRIGDPGADRW